MTEATRSRILSLFDSLVDEAIATSTAHIGFTDAQDAAIDTLEAFAEVYRKEIIVNILLLTATLEVVPGAV